MVQVLERVSHAVAPQGLDKIIRLDNSIEARKGRELFISLKKQDCLT